MGGGMFGGGRGGMGGGMGGGRGGMGAMGSIMTRFQPDFMRRDVPLFQEQLGLDGGQMVIVETLVNDYDLEFQPKVEEVRQQMQERTNWGDLLEPEEVEVVPEEQRLYWRLPDW